jgi:hypothetical protein
LVAAQASTTYTPLSIAISETVTATTAPVVDSVPHVDHVDTVEHVTTSITSVVHHTTSRLFGDLFHH